MCVCGKFCLWVCASPAADVQLQQVWANKQSVTVQAHRYAQLRRAEAGELIYMFSDTHLHMIKYQPPAAIW